MTTGSAYVAPFPTIVTLKVDVLVMPSPLSHTSKTSPGVLIHGSACRGLSRTREVAPLPPDLAPAAAASAAVPVKKAAEADRRNNIEMKTANLSLFNLSPGFVNDEYFLAIFKR